MSSSLDPKIVFSPCYREGRKCVPKCLGYVFGSNTRRRCDNPIGKKKMEEHNGYMARLNSLPLGERAENPLLEKATNLLLCHHHIGSYLSEELENARQKFRDAASEEAKKKKEEETEKQVEVQREADKKENGVIRPCTPCAPRIPPPLLTSPAPYISPAPRTSSVLGLPLTPPATPQSTGECPSESVSESDSEHEDEDQGTGTVDQWPAYQARWKEVVDDGVKKGIPLEYQIPWPVVSGHLADVNHLQARAFFERVSTDMDSLQIGRMLYHEIMRWERSGIRKRFGRSFYKGYKSELKVIRALVRECAAEF